MKDNYRIISSITGTTKRGMADSGANDTFIEVPYGCPGDVVEIERRGKRKKKRQGIITDIISPSKHRIPVRCPHAGDCGETRGKCGGCSFQYIAYDYQLELKKSQIEKALQKKTITTSIADPIPSPQLFGYRNRMDFVVGPSKELGFRSRGSWRTIVDLKECHLISSRMNHVRAALKNWLKHSTIQGWDPLQHSGELRYCVIRETTYTNQLAVIFITSRRVIGKYLEELASCIPSSVTHIYEGVNESPGDVSIVDQYEVIQGDACLTEKINDISYYISPGSFFQTNTKGAQLLLKTVIDWTHECNPKKVLDLYCGSGFFTLQFGAIAEKVIGVELNEQAIMLARKSLNDSCSQKNMKNISFIATNAISYPLPGDIDTLIVDPPRIGLHPKVLQEILTSAAKNIIYVSCNYETLAQNLKILREKYTVEKIQPIDLFPHTPHIETVVKLSR